ncbi:MAG: hypothetical protein H7Z43_03475 [Clostridia bacterium]|nr:hypothetical protein [Deltaproteobacteria bacterium]
MVDVRNIGTGTSDEAVVSLKNQSGDVLFLERGRDKIEALKPGRGKSVELKFALRADPLHERAKEARGDDDEVELPRTDDAVDLRVSVWDSTYGETVSEQLHVPVHEARKAKVEVKNLLLAGNDEVPVFAGADAQMPLLGYAKAGLSIRSDASFEGWYRVEMGTNAVGFIRDSDVKLFGAKAASVKKTAVRPMMAHSVPSIELEVGSLATSTATMRFSGYVRDEQALKDMFVFVNEKKVYYGGLHDMKSENGVYKAPFDITVNLKSGSNTIAVVARESNDLVTRKIFGVYRSDPALAEAPREPAKATR